MQIDIQILSAEASWKHQHEIYKNYHKKYATIYSADKFFYHPYLLEKLSVANLQNDDLQEIATYFKTNIYNREKLEQAQTTILTKGIPFLRQKNELLKQLPIKHPDKLTISLSGAMSGGFYNTDQNTITISPQCITPQFLPLLLTHEFTHICIEEHIQQKHLSHLAKERIVSRICSEILGFDDHNSVGDKTLDKFLTKENMLNDFLSVLSRIKKYGETKQIIENKTFTHATKQKNRRKGG